ncbi:MAG TPA: hypothetical protein VGK49_09050, partial [Ilumatobacteraceae bacterium]
GEPTAEFSTHGATPHPVGAGVNDEHHDFELRDVTPVEWISWTPFIVAIVLFGVLPRLMFDVFDPAVTELVNNLGEHLNP